MNDNDSIMVTPPGGPRPRSAVHQVGAVQAVRRTGDGRYVIEGDALGAQNRRSNGSRGAVITPGGVRARELVHEIEPGATLDGEDGRHRMLHRSGEVIADFGMIHPKPPGKALMPGNIVHPQLTAPTLGSGWITDARWNRPSTPISSFSTTWTVPPAPATQSGQLIYLFNGIQNSTMIYQPVLQWGSNGAFGGNYWCIATWYADGQGGAAFHSTPITVHDGDVLTGVMTLTGQSSQGFSYNGSFQGIANSGYAITNVPELWQAVQTLEAYNVTKCSDYPNTTKTAMSAINIQTGSTTANVVWSVQNAVTDCGQHTLIFNHDSTGHGEVDLWYRGGPFWSVGAGTVAAGAQWESWFSWGANGDVGPQLIQGEPLNQSTGTYLWTTLIGEELNNDGNLVYHATVQNAGTRPVAFQWRGGGR